MPRTWPTDFYDDPDPEITRDASPEAKLAASVIWQALVDARAGDRRAANWLLFADSAVAFWCSVANVSFDVIRVRVRRELQPSSEKAVSARS